ncbi:MAG: class I SAM-dependent methyltransferase [Eubacteriales bacterium]|nr:class I SAM-dependent methyltransferase [Eubacteriales bacterium]
MEMYEDFAQVYDRFMDETPYREWSCFVADRLRQAGIGDGLVLDLGCGTGSMTELLAQEGYDMIGVDLSDRMLDIAMEKRARSGQDILYLQQDMREFELYGTVRAVVCLCDSLNYLLREEELLQTFRLVNNYLDPGGLFLFDFNTVYKYEMVIGDSVIAENREDCSFIWENYYEPQGQLNEYDLTVFVQQEKGLFRKFTETHLQRGYTLETVRSLVERAGLCFVEALDGDTHGPVTKQSGRIFVTAREHGKKDGGKNG